MQVNEVAQVILLISSVIVMGIGVYYDVKDRKFPNKVLFSVVVLGLMFGMLSGHIVESIIGFLMINIIGIICYKWNLLSSGDMKFLSTIFFFLNFKNIDLCLIYTSLFIVFGIVQFSIFYHKKNRNMGKELREGLFSTKALMLYKINTFKTYEFENKEDMLENTVPFTLPMFLAFIPTCFYLIIQFL